MTWLLALSIVGTVLAQDAEDCDPEAIQQELVESSPVVVPDVWGRLVACDAEAGTEAVADAFSRTLAGDAANAAVITALELGADQEMREWLRGLEPDQRMRTIVHLGGHCQTNPAVERFLVESKGELGESYWKERWHRSLVECRTPAVQALLQEAFDGSEAGKLCKDRYRFYGLLEVYARNLRDGAIPALTTLAGELEDEEDLVNVLNAFSDAANVGGSEGTDPEVADQLVAVLAGLGEKLPPRAVEQARTTMVALGAEEEADRLARYRWPERRVDDSYRYAAVAIEDVTCKNSKRRAVFHRATFSEAGNMWPAQLEELLPDKLGYEWQLVAAEKCKGTEEIRIAMPAEPFADDAALEGWFDEQLEAFERSTAGYDKVIVMEHEPFSM